MQKYIVKNLQSSYFLLALSDVTRNDLIIANGEPRSVERLVEGDCVLKHIRHIIIFERLPIVERLVEGGCVWKNFKHHPIRPFLFEPYYYLLKPLMMENILYMVLDETSFYTDNVISNSLVSHIHFTGSVKTLNSISHKTKARITSELGCVTPWIVLPGSWQKNSTSRQYNGPLGIRNEERRN